MKIQLACTLIASIAVAACNGSNGNSSAPPDPGVAVESVGGTAARQVASSDDNEMQTLAQNNNQFATDFYHQQLVGNEGKNLVMSPYSISTAFAMLYGGSANETKQEIQNAFHFTQEEAVFHQAFNTLSQRILKDENDNAFSVNIVNAQWGEKTYDFSQDYLNHLSQFYAADIKVADMIGQSDVLVETVNDWVESQTDSLIEDLLPEGSITSDSRLVLTNAVYFNAKWLDEFDPNDTSERAFALLSGEEIHVPTMDQRGVFNAYREKDQMLVELPYKNTDWSMFLITTSTENFGELEANFSQAGLDALLERASLQDIRIFLPKFSFGTGTTLQNALEPLGMTMAFDGSMADFSLINQRQEMELFIQAAVHKAFITVDEAGTEAAAATGISIGSTSAPPWYQFDQPFMFVIRHKPTGTTLFMGRVVNPLQ